VYLSHNVFLNSHLHPDLQLKPIRHLHLRNTFQSTDNQLTADNQSEMEPMEYNEKGSPAVQSDPPVQESTESAVKQFWHSSTSDRLWHLSQVPALLSCILVVISSGCAYFMSDYVNCDGRSPYSQAWLSGMYAMLLCMNSYLYAHHLREAGKELDGPNALGPQARQTRRRRIPVMLSALAVGQYIAAVASGLAAYRTSRAPLNVGFTCVAAFIGM
jgi:hypothetical protein